MLDAAVLWKHLRPSCTLRVRQWSTMHDWKCQQQHLCSPLPNKNTKRLWMVHGRMVCQLDGDGGMAR
eukprot:347701-Chlamydomonas_euryale.AAC.9